MPLRLGCALGFALVGLVVRAATGDSLEGLRPQHPRLLVGGPEAWSVISDTAESDPRLSAFLAGNTAQARSLLELPPAERMLTGRRLLHVSREVLERILTLGLAYHTTGNNAFALRARGELLAAARFADWNPSHFLDVGEMTAALALGYDWFHAELSPADRGTIRQAIAEKGLRPGIDATSRSNGWHTANNNWNQVCWSGLALGALAIADDEPELAAEVLAKVRTNIPRGLAPYAPDGIYPEGPNYWSYGTTYQVLLIAALQSALGTDWGLAESPGFLASAGAQLQLTGPSGHVFNFSDGREPGALQPALFWFARRLEDPGLVRGQEHFLGTAPPDEPAALTAFVETRRFRPLAALWWPRPDAFSAGPKLPLCWPGDGPNPVAIFRSSWTDPEAFYLAAKGGRANLSHGHMDAGSFVFEAGGVRWAIDLGMQEYETLESRGIGLWNREQDSQRWQVFRLNNRSHNTLTIDGHLHRADGPARIVGFSSEGPDRHATIDLSPVFAGDAETATRRFEFLDDRVRIIDTLSGLQAGAVVRWTMATRAAVRVDGAAALLAQDGRSLQASLRADGIAHFTTAEATPPAEYDAPNPGVSLLIGEAVAPASGSIGITVELRLVD